MQDKYNNRSDVERKSEQGIIELFNQCPLPDHEKLNNLGLFLGRINLQHILLFEKLYQQILDKHGIIIEFGTRWGQNIALLSALRGMYEPFVASRKIVAFDTFEGFPSLGGRDSSKAETGDFSTTKGYEQYLEAIMACHEQKSPISHIKKYEIIKGDACQGIEKYLKDNPETIIALVYFDMKIYEPTKKCLEAVKEYMTKGGVIAFDQLNLHDHPGETIAFREVFGNKCQLRRWPLSSSMSYIVI